jgi:acetyl-CoA synthetase
VVSIEPGEDFVHAIERAVASCDVLIAVVGKDWHDLRDRDGWRACRASGLSVQAVQAKSPRFAHLVLAGQGARSALSLQALMASAEEELTAATTGPDDPAFMMYTSGTTGEPKGVLHGHRWIIATGDPILGAVLRLGPGDVCYQPQDWSFIYPLGCNFLYPLLAGAAIVIPRGRFDPVEAFATVERYGVTLFCAVPTIYQMMLAVPEAERPARLSWLRRGISAGEPLPADTFREWRERFDVLLQDGIGQTECHMFVGNSPDGRIKPGCMGRPLPTWEVAILDDDGRPQPTGEPGHLVLRNDHPGLALGYYRDPERWAAVNRAGWYYTKDFALVDDEGDYWYVSRSDDLIKSRGYLISPKEAESAIMEHPSVLEARVVGVPHDVPGQRVKAYVTLKPGHAPGEQLAEAIRAHARQLIAPFKAPREIEFVAELPKTLTGKVLRQLRGRT